MPIRVSKLVSSHEEKFQSFQFLRHNFSTVSKIFPFHNQFCYNYTEPKLSNFFTVYWVYLYLRCFPINDKVKCSFSVSLQTINNDFGNFLKIFVQNRATFRLFSCLIENSKLKDTSQR